MPNITYSTRSRGWLVAGSLGANSSKCSVSYFRRLKGELLGARGCVVWVSRRVRGIRVVATVVGWHAAQALPRIVRWLLHILLSLGPRPCLASRVEDRMPLTLPDRMTSCLSLYLFAVTFALDTLSISYTERGSVRLFLSHVRRHTDLILLLQFGVDIH